MGICRVPVHLHLFSLWFLRTGLERDRAPCQHLCFVEKGTEAQEALGMCLSVTAEARGLPPNRHCDVQGRARGCFLRPRLRQGGGTHESTFPVSLANLILGLLVTHGGWS